MDKDTEQVNLAVGAQNALTNVDDRGGAVDFPHPVRAVDDLVHPEATVVINADKVQLTGNKADHKTYYRHSGYNGGLKAESFRTAMEKHPEKVIERAVRGMLPKTTLGRKQLAKLKVYAGSEHPHAAQNPVKIEVEA